MAGANLGEAFTYFFHRCVVRREFVAGATLGEAFTAVQAHLDADAAAHAATHAACRTPSFSLKILHPRMEFTHSEHSQCTLAGMFF